MRSWWRWGLDNEMELAGAVALASRINVASAGLFAPLVPCTRPVLPLNCPVPFVTFPHKAGAQSVHLLVGNATKA